MKSSVCIVCSEKHSNCLLTCLIHDTGMLSYSSESIKLADCDAVKCLILKDMLIDFLMIVDWVAILRYKVKIDLGMVGSSASFDVQPLVEFLRAMQIIDDTPIP